MSIHSREYLSGGDVVGGLGRELRCARGQGVGHALMRQRPARGAGAGAAIRALEAGAGQGLDARVKRIRVWESTSCYAERTYDRQ